MPLAAISCLSLAAKLEEVGVPNDIRALQVELPAFNLHLVSFYPHVMQYMCISSLQIYLLLFFMPYARVCPLLSSLMLN